MMPKTGPYEVLGVGRDATLAQIKKAYRKKAKSLHPDAGGDAEDFNRLNEAYELLCDPADREIYDNTGAWPKKGPKVDPEMELMPILRQIVSNIMQEGGDPAHTDLRATILRHLTSQRANMENQLGSAKAKVRKTQRLQGRFIREEGPDLLGDIIAQGLRELEAQVEQGQKALDLHERVTQFFMSYQYKKDPPPEEGQNPGDGPFNLNHFRLKFD